MAKKIVRSFQYRSSRSSSVIYSVLYYSDDSFSCNCAGFVEVHKDGTRTCKHCIAAAKEIGIAYQPHESVSAKKQLQQTAGKKVLRHGESAQMSMRTVRKFRFEDED